MKDHQVNLLCCQSLLLLWGWLQVWKLIQKPCVPTLYEPKVQSVSALSNQRFVASVQMLGR